MGIQRRRLRRSQIALAGTVAVLASAGSALALQGLPPGVQVNSDAAAGINPALNVSGEEPTNADVVGGALTAGKVAVPWSIFRQATASGQGPDLLALVCGRRLDDAWRRDGRRTLERLDGDPRLAELRPGPGRRGSGDRLRRRGPDRAVGHLVRKHDQHRRDVQREQHLRQPVRRHPEQVGVRRPGSRHWRRGTTPVPSLNIHTNRDAENPSVAGGTTAPGGNPGPWITWQEKSERRHRATPTRSSSRSRSGPGTTSCDRRHALAATRDVRRLGGLLLAADRRPPRGERSQA